MVVRIPIVALAGLAVVVLFGPGRAADAPAAPAAAPAAGYAGAEVCATCHGDVVTALAATAHGKTHVTDWDGGAACETCHGPGAAHAESGDASKIRSPRKLTSPQASAACLACHERSERSHWKGSPHDGRDLSCLTCHTIHQAGKPHVALLTKETEFDTCGSCHLRRKAALMRSSHMPMREGTMICSSCHNPHGSTGPSLLKQETVNDNCYACHAEKKAPMLWEHPPVKENCLTCHDPHGSLHPRMQIAKQPRLCQNCHDESRHPTQPYADASPGSEFFPGSRMFDRGCLNCHSQIHGSNHPAGMRLLR